MSDKLLEHILEYGINKSWADTILYITRNDAKKRLKSNPNNTYVSSGDFVRKMADFHTTRILKFFY